MCKALFHACSDGLDSTCPSWLQPCWHSGYTPRVAQSSIPTIRRYPLSCTMRASSSDASVLRRKTPVGKGVVMVLCSMPAVMSSSWNAFIIPSTYAVCVSVTRRSSPTVWTWRLMPSRKFASTIFAFQRVLCAVYMSVSNASVVPMASQSSVCMDTHASSAYGRSVRVVCSSDRIRLPLVI